MNRNDLKKKYEIEKKCLGKGQYGKIYKAVDKDDPSIQIAIKVINK